MAQLYAACRPNGPLVVRHVQLVPQLQAQLDGVFQAQEAEFLAGINNDVVFTGDWTPDPDELLVIPAFQEALALVQAAAGNAVALQPLDAANFEQEGVRALFTVVGPPNGRRLLLQNFSAPQLLSGRMAFLSNGNVFRRLTEPTFTLGTHLVAIVTPAGDVRFKSYALLRRVFDLSPIFRAATDAELVAFAGHASLLVADPNAFAAGADEILRKQVHAITKANVLGTHPVVDLQIQAAAIGFPLVVTHGRIEMPIARANAKELLSFLLNRVYLGPINQQLMISNSTRPL